LIYFFLSKALKKKSSNTREKMSSYKKTTNKKQYHKQADDIICNQNRIKEKSMARPPKNVPKWLNPYLQFIADKERNKEWLKIQTLIKEYWEMYANTLPPREPKPKTTPDPFQSLQKVMNKVEEKLLDAQNDKQLIDDYKSKLQESVPNVVKEIIQPPSTSSIENGKSVKGKGFTTNPPKMLAWLGKLEVDLKSIEKNIHDLTSQIEDTNLKPKAHNVSKQLLDMKGIIKHVKKEVCNDEQTNTKADGKKRKKSGGNDDDDDDDVNNYDNEREEEHQKEDIAEGEDADSDDIDDIDDSDDIILNNSNNHTINSDDGDEEERRDEDM
jgi:hypothetical protein